LKFDFFFLSVGWDGMPVDTVAENENFKATPAAQKKTRETTTKFIINQALIH